MYQSQFIEMFGTPASNELGLPTKYLNEISNNLDSKRIPITSGNRKEGPYPYYGASGIVDHVADYIFDETLLLISEDGANLKDRVTPIAFTASGKYWVNNHAHILRFKDISLHNYVEHFINYLNVEKYLTGMAQPKLNQDRLNAIPVNMPSSTNIAKFHCICKQVDKSKFSGLKSQFIEMFKDAPIVKLGEHINTQSGGTPSTKKTEYYEGGDIPWLSSGEVNQGYINGTENYITKAGLDNSSAKWSPEHSIVIAMYGATAGKVGYLNIPVTTNQAVCTLLPSSSFAPKFLYYAVSNKSSWMVSQCRGAAQPNISQGIIRKMEIPMPEKSLQREFVLIVEQADKSKQIAFSRAS